jgi:hypothetical protein
VLPDELADGVFEKLQQEVQWNKMMHRGKFSHLVAALFI